jgi:hypothetical protein
MEKNNNQSFLSRIILLFPCFRMLKNDYICNKQPPSLFLQPQSYFVQRLLCDFKEDLDAVKEFYNENYEEICENLFPEDLLSTPEQKTLTIYE